MGVFDIIHFTEASLEHKDDEPSVWACFGFYPKDITWTQLVYDAVMYGEHLAHPQKAIVKLRRFRAGTEDFWQSRIDANIHASGVACAFTEKTGAGKISFVKQYLAPLKGYSRWDKLCRGMKQYDFRDFKKDEIVLIEPLCADSMTFFKGDIVLDAFSHFSYVEGKQQSVIAIFKGKKNGNEYCLVTPKIFTSIKEINEYFKDHICNHLCEGWAKPYVNPSPKTPIFRLPNENLKLKRQTSMKIQDPIEVRPQVRAPLHHSNSRRSSHASLLEHQDSMGTASKRKVTTIMHAVYVHENPKDAQQEQVSGASNAVTEKIDTSFMDKASSSPKIKNVPVRVNTLNTHNVGIPKQLNVQPSGKPTIKPKPDLKKNAEKPKPELKPKPEIKPKPKLKKQDKVEHDVEKDFQYGVQKMAVQDELKAKLSRIKLKNNPEEKPSSVVAPVQVVNGPTRSITLPSAPFTSSVGTPIQVTDQPIKNDFRPLASAPVASGPPSRVNTPIQVANETDKSDSQPSTPILHRDKALTNNLLDNISHNSQTISDLNASNMSLGDSQTSRDGVSEKKVKSQKSKKSLRKQPALAT